MKKSIPLVLAQIFVLNSLIVKVLHAQEIEGKTYKIVKGSHHKEIIRYQKAFEKANWDCYRTRSESRIIEFDNGIVFELFSATQALANGVNVPGNCLTNPNEILDKKPVYSLTSENLILEAAPNYSSSKEIKALEMEKNKSKK